MTATDVDPKVERIERELQRLEMSRPGSVPFPLFRYVLRRMRTAEYLLQTDDKGRRRQNMPSTANHRITPESVYGKGDFDVAVSNRVMVKDFDYKIAGWPSVAFAAVLKQLGPDYAASFVMKTVRDALLADKMGLNIKDKSNGTAYNAYTNFRMAFGRLVQLGVLKPVEGVRGGYRLTEKAVVAVLEARDFIREAEASRA